MVGMHRERSSKLDAFNEAAGSIIALASLDCQV